MAGQIWADVPGYEGRYQVSDDGEVLALNFRRTGSAGLLQQHVNAGGYPQVKLCKGGIRRSHCTHVLVAAAFLGPRPAGQDINHIDGVKTNRRASNLEYCSHSENAKHAHALGLMTNRGERNPRCKISDADLVRLKEMVKLGVPRAVIASTFKVSGSRVSQIKHWGRHGTS